MEIIPLQGDKYKNIYDRTFSLPKKSIFTVFNSFLNVVGPT